MVADDLQLDAVRRAGIVSMHDGAPDKDISRNLFELQRIEEGVAARVYDHGVRGLEVVIGRKLPEVVDVFELAPIEWHFQRKSPIGTTLGPRPRQANY